MPEYVFEVMWYITERCNLNCLHCYRNTLLDEMNINDVSKVLNELNNLSKKYKILRVGILGGEPLVYPHLFTVIKMLRNNGYNVNISTNGTLINKSIAKKLKSHDVTFVQVSLDGASAETHDKIRGKGNFYRTINGIKFLINENISVGIMFTISKINYREIDKIVELAEKIGVDVVSFSRYIPIGITKNNLIYRKILLKPNEYFKIIEKIYNISLNKNKIKIYIEDPLYYIYVIKNNPKLFKNIRFGGCSAGISVIAIMPNGDVYPCRRLPIKIGNILNQNIYEILNNIIIKKLKKRDNLKGKCSICPYKWICGGCRGYAYALTGDIFASDPLCPYTIK